MPNYATQRLNMVDAQVRTNDVTDPRIHEAMADVPRERFVPVAKRALAYADVPVEISPQNAYLRRLQHQLVSENELSARSMGKEPQRRLRITPSPEEPA